MLSISQVNLLLNEHSARPTQACLADVQKLNKAGSKETAQ